LDRKEISFDIGDRKIFIHTQHTQTIKICTTANSRGEYKKYYRISPGNVINNENFDSLKNSDSLTDLEDIIIKNFKGKREKTREYKPTIIKPSYNPSGDTELERIKQEVEKAIDLFIDEFIKTPYLHRVEHSIHTQLFHIMMGNSYLSQQVVLGDGKTKTSLVHKEWPWPIKDKIRRATFDFAVLTQDYLDKDCRSIKEFHKGASCPPIIIEIGLDYGYGHLKKDNDKLIKFLNQGYIGYLIHLERKGNKKSNIENVITKPTQPTKGGIIKTAYALITDKINRCKHINDVSIV
jgi:hypothetical protein